LATGNESFIDGATNYEELYAIDSSIILQVLGTALGLIPLILDGTSRQHKRFPMRFITCDGGSLASIAHTEPSGTAN
jgi:hypothetical protein